MDENTENTPPQELNRLLKTHIQKILDLGKSILLLGPRQTGKTTLLAHFSADKTFTLANPKDRLRYEKDPSLLTGEIEYLAEQLPTKPLIIIDEIQKLPLLMDAAQDLIDRKLAQFILTGSSARKLKRNADNEVNLLPGRLISIRMDPLTYRETPENYLLENFLLEGSLPEIVLQENLETQELLLDSYVTTYLEEEVRAEALVRDLGSFARFLELAASEAGNIMNLSKLSQEIGIPHGTISAYFQILEDCLITERIEPITESKTRKKLSRSHKYLFFDLGVRRVAAREGRQPPREKMGFLFEHWIGLELIRTIRLSGKRHQVKYWSDPSGPEVDWVIDAGTIYIPIEVKWTDRPRIEDARHLQVFLREYPTAQKGFVICNTPHALKLSDEITALPWRQLGDVFEGLDGF